MAATPHDPPPAGRPARSRAPGPARPGAGRAGPAGSASRAPLAVAATVAAGLAAALSYAPVAAVVALGAIGSGGTPSEVARFALACWLLGHGVPIATTTDQVSLMPLAVTALAGWRVARAGVHASRATGGQRSRSVWPAVSAAVAVAMVYAGLGAGAATIASTPVRSLSPPRAALTMGCFGLLAAGLGALSRSRAARARWARAPASVTGAVRAGLVAAALVLAGGAVAAGAAVAVRGGQAAQVLGSYRTGVLGQAGITVVGLAYAPNLAVWAAAYLLGPGFAVGVGTVVSPSVVILGSVPAVPVLAGLPATPASGAWTGLLAVPLLAGVAAGVSLGRRRRRDRPPGTARSGAGVLGAAVLAGPVAGAIIQVAALVSAGALGSGQLQTLGPAGWRVGMVTTVVVGMGALVGAAATRTVPSAGSGRRDRTTGHADRPAGSGRTATVGRVGRGRPAE